MNLVDFCAIAPAYVELAFSGSGGGFAVLRILRLARIFRVIKVGTFKENLDLVVEAYVTLEQPPSQLEWQGHL